MQRLFKSKADKLNAKVDTKNKKKARPAIIKKKEEESKRQQDKIRYKPGKNRQLQLCIDKLENY